MTSASDTVLVADNSKIDGLETLDDVDSYETEVSVDDAESESVSDRVEASSSYVVLYEVTS